MANRGVQGHIVDESGTGIAGLYVTAYDAEALLGDTFLPNTATQSDPIFPGLVKTGNDGGFSIGYPENAYGLETKPDIVLKIYDRVKRLIHITPVASDVTDNILNLNEITINRQDAEGFAVTLGQGTPQFRSAGNKIEFLIDNAAGWEQITDSVRIATATIHILQLYIDVADYETDSTKDLVVI